MARRRPTSKADARERFITEYGFLREIGGRNFRDLGGHPSNLKGRVRKERIFRSAHLAAVPEASELRALQLSTLVTLQSRVEVSWLGKPDEELFGSARWVHIPIGDKWFEEEESIIVNQEGGGRGHLVLVTGFKEAWRKFFGVLAERNVYPLLFHCSAGRDRTGVGAAMLLELLGVNRKLIVADFLQSNSVFPKELLEAAMLKPLFDTIDDCGGIEPFMLEELGLEATALKAIQEDLLEP